LSKAQSTKVDIVKWYNFLTFDIMAELTFGEPLHLLDSSEYTAWVKVVLAAFKVMMYKQVFTRIPVINRLLELLIPKSVLKMRQQSLQHSIDRVDKRLANEPDKPDIWSHVLRFSNSDKNSNRGLSMIEMYSNSHLFMVAGIETTATLLSGVTYMLGKNPDAMSRLKSEVASAFATIDSINLDQLAELKYLNACLEEVLRMYPPVPVGLPRVAPAPGAVISGQFVPAVVSHVISYDIPTHMN
jgi:cytochrome P450